MTPEQIDRILVSAANRVAPHDPDPSVIERAKVAVPRSFRPVRPLAPSWFFVLAFVGVFAAVSVMGAWAFGVRGLPLLSGIRRAVIFSVLLAGAVFAAIASVREMSPASGRRIGLATLAVGILALLAAFALLFRNYDVRNFIVEGVPCLGAGLACAIPAAAVTYLLLRRGFVLDWRAAGIAAGTLAGLAGLGMLEIHCAILKAPHVMFWHVAVVLVSGIGGLLIGWFAHAAGRK